MTNLKRKLLAAAMLGIVSVGAFAQRQGEEKRPPKPDNKVVVKEKETQRPPQNSNQSGNKGEDKRGKP